MAYVRTVQTASGATAVQVVYSKRRGARRMEHIGSAHDEQEVEALKAAARQRLAGGQQRTRASTAPWKPRRGRWPGSRATSPLPEPSAGFVIGAYHRLFQIEASFRMSKHDLAARPIFHHKRESIEAHLTIVFASLAVSRFIEERTGWSIRKFVRTARR